MGLAIAFPALVEQLRSMNPAPQDPAQTKTDASACPARLRRHDENMTRDLTPRALVGALAKMPDEEFDAIMCRTNYRRAGMPVPSKAAHEKELLRRIRQKPAHSLKQRHKQLHQSSLDRTLTRDEKSELEQLVDLLENSACERLRLVIELAGLRGWTLDRTWQSLGLGKGIPIRA